jgi:RNA polymerase sigma-70 factor (ECF subfamily)
MAKRAKANVPDFETVYEEHVWRVYGFFGYRVSTRADAEDLTQQTFERALRAWSRYQPARAPVSAWLMVIARNLLIDHLRADKSANDRSLDDYDLDTREAPPGPSSLGLDPDLEYALAQLGQRERELIALRFGAGLSGPQIAEVTGLSLAYVQQLFSRSLRRMRASLEGAGGVRQMSPEVHVRDRVSGSASSRA